MIGEFTMLNRIFAGLLAVCLGSSAYAQTIQPNQTPITQLPVTQEQGGTSISPLQLKHFRPCVAGMLNGTNRCSILYIGDSTVQGAENSVYGDTQLTVTAQLASQMTKVGVPADNGGFCGAGGVIKRQGTDNRITVGVWTNTSASTVGGNPYGTVQTTGSPFVFAPVVAVDTFKIIWYNPGQTAGSVTATATGGTPVTLANTGGNTLVTTTVSAAILSSANTLSLSPNTSSSVNVTFNCLLAYNSTAPSVDIYNAGAYGQNVTQWVSNAQPNNSLPLISYLAPTLCLIESGINELGAGVTVPTYTADLQLIISACQINGDAVLVTGNYSASNNTSTYFDAARALAAADGIPIFSTDQRFISTAAALATTPPLIGPDSIHPTAAGTRDIATGETRMIANQ